VEIAIETGRSISVFQDWPLGESQEKSEKSEKIILSPTFPNTELSPDFKPLIVSLKIMEDLKTIWQSVQSKAFYI